MPSIASLRPVPKLPVCEIGYHKWKERDFTHVLPKFDNAAYLAPILYNAILWDN